MTDLYADLDVARDAPAPDIKRAYRRKAKRAHPDVGGSAKEFERISRAFMVLSDPARRSRYDTDGTIEEKPVDNRLAKTLEFLSLVMDEVVGECAKTGQKPEHFDMIKSMRDRMAKHRAERAKKRKDIETAVEWWDTFAPRFTSNDGANHMERLVRGKVVALHSLRAQIEQTDRIDADALALLAKFQFRRDEVSMQTLMQQAARSAFGQTSTGAGGFGGWSST